MGEDEFREWASYYMANPFDDYHRFHRPAALIAASFNGELQNKLDWLRPPESTSHTSADLDLFRAAGFTPPRKAK